MGARSKMSKKKSKPIRRPAATPKRFTPPNCSSCLETRKELGKDGENFTEVYGTRPSEIGIMRYCRCGFCGTTWKVTEPKNSTAVENAGS